MIHRLSTAVLVLATLVSATPFVQAALIFHDDFNDEASADPPGGWTRTSQVPSSVSLETSATSSVRLAESLGTTRIISTALPTFNPQSAPAIELTVKVDATSGSSNIFALAGMSDDTSLSNTFFVDLQGNGVLRARSRSSDTAVFSNISLTTLAGYSGNAVTITSLLDSSGFRVTTDFGSYDSGFLPWSTMTNGFDLSDLGTSNSAFLQTTGSGSADFGLISVLEIPEPTTLALAALGLIGLTCCGRKPRR